MGVTTLHSLEVEAVRLGKERRIAERGPSHLQETNFNDVQKRYHPERMAKDRGPGGARKLVQWLKGKI